MPELSQHQFGRLAEAMHQQGGFTADAHTGELVRHGWAVAAPRSVEGSFDMDKHLPQHLADYHRQHRETLHEAGHIGGWEENGKAVVDASRVHSDSVSGFTRAANEMQEKGERAIYGLSAASRLPGSERGREFFSNPQTPKEILSNAHTKGQMLNRGAQIRRLRARRGSLD